MVLTEQCLSVQQTLVEQIEPAITLLSSYLQAREASAANLTWWPLRGLCAHSHIWLV